MAEEKTLRERVNEELEKIRRRNGGTIKQEHVVQYARKKGTALFEEFDRAGLWNDKVAAEKARLDYAGTIIRAYVFVRDDSRGPVRALVSLHEDRKKDGVGYRHLNDVLGDEDLTQQLIETAMMELRSFERKYSKLRELDGVFDAVRVVEHRRRARKKTTSEDARAGA